MTPDSPESPGPASVWHPWHIAAVTVIAATRRELGLRQDDLAKRVGWRRWRIATIEGYNRHLYFPEFIVISIGLGQDPGDMIKRVLLWAETKSVGP